MTTPTPSGAGGPSDGLGSSEAAADANFLRTFAAGLTYNDTAAEGDAKYRLYEIAMRLKTSYYVKRSFEAGQHVGAGMERAALSERKADTPEPPYKRVRHLNGNLTAEQVRADPLYRIGDIRQVWVLEQDWFSDVSASRSGSGDRE